MDKILTISVSAYNVEEHLEKTLSSIERAKSVLDLIEVYVIDDGGSDNSIYIAKAFQDKHPSVFYAVHKENGGYGSTINYSIKHATGKYFKQLDGDDWLNSEGLIDVVNKLMELDVDYFFTKTRTFTEGKPEYEEWSNFYYLENGEYFFDEVKYKSYISMHNAIIKTALLQENQIKISENCFYTDTEYVNSCLKYSNTFYVYNVFLYAYRKGRVGQSTSQEGTKKHYLEFIEVFWRLIDIYNALPINSAKRDLVMFRIDKSLKGCFNRFVLLEPTLENKLSLVTFATKLKTQCPEALARYCSRKDLSNEEKWFLR